MSTYQLSEIATLSTEHPASSYGMPVLLIGDQAFGPGDIVDGQIPKNVFSFLNAHPTTAADYAFDCYCLNLPYGSKRLKSQAPELLVLFVGNFEHCHEPYASWHTPTNWIDFFFGVLDYYRVGK